MPETPEFPIRVPDNKEKSAEKTDGKKEGDEAKKTDVRKDAQMLEGELARQQKADAILRALRVKYDASVKLTATPDKYETIRQGSGVETVDSDKERYVISYALNEPFDASNPNRGKIVIDVPKDTTSDILQKIFTSDDIQKRIEGARRSRSGN